MDCFSPYNLDPRHNHEQLSAIGDVNGKYQLAHAASFQGQHVLIQEVAALMNKDATLAELADIVHAHPTLGEIILNAAHA
ncbi:MAG: hypothetical protein IKO67_07510 [Bacteroidaceae bacterium]|nr:hypothetical protein [Bacteroidaceae bacterium]